MTYIDYETCSECGFQMAYGGECGECADRRPKAARTPADDTGEVAALIGAIDAHHAALSEDVLLEAIVQEVLATDGLTETSSGGLYSVHEDDLEVLAKAALCTVRAADDAAEVEGAYNEMSYRLDEARAEADRLREQLAVSDRVIERLKGQRASDERWVQGFLDAVREVADDMHDPLRGKSMSGGQVQDALWAILATAADPVSLADVRCTCDPGPEGQHQSDRCAR